MEQYIYAIKLKKTYNNNINLLLKKYKKNKFMKWNH